MLDHEKTIRMLRFALASIWTELEKEAEDLGGKADHEGCQGIAHEALKLSEEYAPGKCPGNDWSGVEGWHEFKKARGWSNDPRKIP